MIVVIIVAALMVIMGILILIGKGDMLIAGYNTASKKEREKVNIKRLRALVGGFLILIAPLMCWCLIVEQSKTSGFAFCGIVFFLCIVLVVLANTWAKK